MWIEREEFMKILRSCKFFLIKRFVIKGLILILRFKRFYGRDGK